MSDLFEFTRAHPDCTHCGTVERALTIWPNPSTKNALAYVINVEEP